MQDQQQEYEKDILDTLDTMPMLFIFGCYFYMFVFGLAVLGDRSDLAEMYETIGAVCCASFSAILSDAEFFSEYHPFLFKYRRLVAFLCGIISLGLFIASYATWRWAWWASSFAPLIIVIYRVWNPIN